MADMSDHWRIIFADLVDAAQRPDILSKLKTADLPDEVKAEQWAKYKRLTVLKNDAVEMPKAGFVSRYKDGETIAICVQTSDFNSQEIVEISNCLAEFGAHPEDMDESTFMKLTHGLKGLYRVKDEHLGKDAAWDLIGISESPSYVGHEIHHLLEIFEDVRLYKIEHDSILASCSKWFLAAYLCSSCSAFRSKSFPTSTSDKLKELLMLRNTNPEHIFYAATSIHLRQCFLEVYRGLESLFYLPWIISLKRELNITENSRSLAASLRKNIGWRQKEKESILKLFSLFEIEKIKSSPIAALPSFADLDFEKLEIEKISRRIYKIRNILVHQEDYEDPSRLTLTQECWPVLVDFLVEVAIDLYTKYAADADFN